MSGAVDEEQDREARAALFERFSWWRARANQTSPVIASNVFGSHTAAVTSPGIRRQP